MAVRYAVATGNWSNVATWDGGAALPGAGDDVYANGYVVQVNVAYDVTKISTELCPTTSIAGGGFELASYAGARTFIGNIVAGTTQCLNTLGGQTTAATFIGNIFGGTSGNAYGLFLGTLTAGAAGMFPTIIGNITGGSGTTAHGIATRADRNYAANITGNITAGTGGNGCNITGTAVTSTIVGNVTAVGANYGFVQQNGYVNFTGVLTSSAQQYGMFCTIYYLSGTMVNTGGQNAFLVTSNAKVYVQNGGALSYRFNKPDLTNITLYSTNVVGFPAESDVRDGTLYGPISELEGTLVVPGPSNVVAGVATDDTVGTWVFTPEVIQRLLNCSTVAITGQQIASHNGAPAELIPTYEKRYDFVPGTPDIMYLGAAPVGTLDASTVWTLTKLVLAVDGSITSETHATDSWDNHLTAIYT